MSEDTLFQDLGEIIAADKGQQIFQQGQHDGSIYWVMSGLLKASYVTTDGKELIKSFVAPGDFIGSLTACHAGEPCTFTLICLKQTSLRKIAFAELQRLAANNLAVSQRLMSGLIELAMKKERREYEFLCLSAPDRYQKFKERYPDLLDEITQSDIARYLGITPVALSRIKQRQT